MASKRIIILFSVLAVVILTAMLGWWASLNIESPADAAARTAPPKPSPILVPVEKRVLSSKVVTRGTARFGLPQPVSITPSVIKSKPGLLASLPIRNKQLKEGDIILSASGRPVFIMQGTVPVYRDLIPGTIGKDVAQLEQALKRLGFNPGLIDGRFTTKTSNAIKKFYKSHGVKPFYATTEQISQYRTLKQKWSEVNKRKQAAAYSAKTAWLTLKSVRANADHRRKNAASELAIAQAERAMVVLDPRQPQSARNAAEKKLELAWAAANKAQLDGELAIRKAQVTQKLEKMDAKLTQSKEKRLYKELKLARSKLGIQIPADEIVFIKTLPVRVEKLVSTIGSSALGEVMTVTNNQLAIDSSLTLETAQLVKLGMKVSIDEQALGVNAIGTISYIAATPGTRGVDGYHVYFEVSVDATKTKLEGYSLRLTIPIESSKGSVIAIPVSALSLATDGRSRLQIETKSGKLKYIIVKPGMSADGYVEVFPVNAVLSPGQLVVVGYDNPINELLQ
ncbi:Chromosome partition protein smc [hydrothermal vent metagenome]|uniref:Chromosome partition protein smc n=1 Tax=hydrothermal vent metagenome TaxID=652676 RepID=A0A3B1AKP4_9ZZZZ